MEIIFRCSLQRELPALEGQRCSVNNDHWLHSNEISCVLYSADTNRNFFNLQSLIIKRCLLPKMRHCVESTIPQMYNRSTAVLGSGDPHWWLITERHQVYKPTVDPLSLQWATVTVDYYQRNCVTSIWPGTYRPGNSGLILIWFRLTISVFLVRKQKLRDFLLEHLNTLKRSE